MHWIFYAAKDETEAEQVAELLEAVASGQVSLEKLEILVSKLQIVAPNKHPSEWTESEWDKYYASLPANAYVMTDAEVLEDNNREERGEYLDVDAFLALEPEENDAGL